MSGDDFNESFRRWNAVPLSDLRGQHTKMLNYLAHSFEKKLPPWRRCVMRSNGRWLYRVRIIKPIRGVHVRTLSK